MKKILVTGGCGFIGSAFILRQIAKNNSVINIDKLTYSGDPQNLSEVKNHKNYHFFKADICNQKLIYKILKDFKIDFVVNLAAESHVDNSIATPGVFIKTNVNGTFSLLTASLKYWQELKGNKKENFRFLHVSTDEVFGSLSKTDPKFNEKSPYRPNSPYSASKAASDHLVRAWNETYNLPTIITNCSNNFGPRQHKEKLIPTVIFSCLENKNIPIYGNGKNIRDWIFVDEHCRGIELALEKGKIGGTYCLGGNSEKENIELVNLICEILDKLHPRKDKKSYKTQITFVKDRPGHDLRYAIDGSKAKKELGFEARKDFEKQLIDTVIWYLDQ